jgi:HNH endonuclease
LLPIVPISELTKQSVRKRANYLCEYCHSLEILSANRFTIDHIVPQSLGGSDDIDNLALACRRCNERRYNFVAGIDPQTQDIVPIFNPRQQQWAEHFGWTADGTEIVGSSPIGRATCVRFDLNDMRYPENDSIRQTRRLWTRIGLHPPSNDPKV